MQQMKTLKFTCRGCNAQFEFDNVGEFEFVPCPACGTDHMTVRKSGRLILDNFDLLIDTPIYA